MPPPLKLPAFNLNYCLSPGTREVEGKHSYNILNVVTAGEPGAAAAEEDLSRVKDQQSQTTVEATMLQIRELL